MGICSILAAFADILQNPTIFAGILISLFGLGFLSIIVPAGWIPVRLADMFGFDSSIRTTLKPFGLSCLVLGGMIYVFSAISAEAEPEGGALAKAFPEIEKIQIALGRVERDLGELKQQSVAIKQDTGQLVETVVKWISLDVSLGTSVRTTTTGETHYFQDGIHATFSNETGQTFEDVSLLVTDGKKELIAETVKILPQDGYKHNSYEDRTRYDKVSVCLIAKRRGRDEWVQENRVYESKQARLTDRPLLELTDATGQRVVEQKPTCSL